MESFGPFLHFSTLILIENGWNFAEKGFKCGNASVEQSVKFNVLNNPKYLIYMHDYEECCESMFLILWVWIPRRNK